VELVAVEHAATSNLSLCLRHSSYNCIHLTVAHPAIVLRPRGGASASAMELRMDFGGGGFVNPRRCLKVGEAGAHIQLVTCACAAARFRLGST
jgi:hypothetical protein